MKLILSKGVKYVSSEESAGEDDKTYRRPFTWIKKKYLDNWIGYTTILCQARQTNVPE